MEAEGATTQKEPAVRGNATRTRLTADQPGTAPRPDVTSVVGEFPIPFRFRAPATRAITVALAIHTMLVTAARVIALISRERLSSL